MEGFLCSFKLEFEQGVVSHVGGDPFLPSGPSETARFWGDDKERGD
jgi:hypothetical protein